jgi:hypothetical protein
MPKVWVANKGNHRYSSAEEFGSLEFITEGNVNIFATDNLQAAIEDRLQGYNGAVDFLLLSGHILPNCLATNFLLQKFDNIQCLVWTGRKYCRITVNK